MNRSVLPVFTFLCLICLSACTDSEKLPEGKPVVFTAVSPYQGLLEQIAGDSITVRSLVSESDDPHSYSPTPREVSELAKASLYFTAELPFESALLKKLKEGNPNVKVIDIVSGIDRRTFEPGEHDHEEHAEHDHEEHAEHDHEEHAKHDHEEHAEHDHDHEELDPHVWLSPVLLAEQAKVMTDAVADILPEEEQSKVRESGEAVIKKIEETNKELSELLAPMRGQAFYVYHGAFGYFADAYGLKQIPVEINGRTPEPKRLTALVKKAEKDGVKVIFVQPQFDQSSARALAESIGGTVVSIDPLAKDPVKNLRDIAEKIRTL